MKQQDNIWVKKFGGTSVGSIERIEAVADRIFSDRQKGQNPIVVVSAMSGETNRLVDLAHQVSPENRGPAFDMLVSSGEQVSVALLTLALQKRGVPAKGLLAFQLGIQTDAFASKARIQRIDEELLLKLIRERNVPIIAGFQGIDEDDNITTLGRGGSDTTAVAVAAALNARFCEIYTDVPAVCTADPRLVPKASELKSLDFEEMLEMASLGSKVLHTRSVEIAAKYGVGIHLRSTFEQREGTWIVPEGESMEKPVVSSVTHDPKAAVCKVYPVPIGVDLLAKVFDRLAENEIVVDIISQSQTDENRQRLAFSIPEDDVPLCQQEISKLMPNESEVQFFTDVAKISVVGVGMRNHPGVAARFFKVMSKLGVNIHLVTTSEIKISAVIDRKDLEKSARALHAEFDLDRD